MENGYRFIKDLTSDVMFEATGEKLGDVFVNASKALFDIICQRDKIITHNIIILSADGDDPKDLMYNWLQTLIASVDIDEMFYKNFEVVYVTDKSIRMRCHGEPISKEKGETVVKAVTYHNFEFEKTEKGYITKVVVDI